MADTGVETFATFVGSNWLNHSNASTSNNSHSVYDIEFDDVSDYFTASDASSIDIPTGATIDGIEMLVEAKSSGDVDRLDCIIMQGGVAGVDKEAGSALTNNDVTKTYGGVADLWSDTWTEADIENSGFGCRIRFVNNDEDNDELVNVDRIQTTVYYTEAAGGITHAASGSLQSMSQISSVASMILARRAGPLTDSQVSSIGSLTIADSIGANVESLMSAQSEMTLAFLTGQNSDSQVSSKGSMTLTASAGQNSESQVSSQNALVLGASCAMQGSSSVSSVASSTIADGGGSNSDSQVGAAGTLILGAKSELGSESTVSSDNNMVLSGRAGLNSDSITCAMSTVVGKIEGDVAAFSDTSLSASADLTLGMNGAAATDSSLSATGSVILSGKASIQSDYSVSASPSMIVVSNGACCTSAYSMLSAESLLMETITAEAGLNSSGAVRANGSVPSLSIVALTLNIQQVQTMVGTVQQSQQFVGTIQQTSSHTLER